MCALNIYTAFNYITETVCGFSKTVYENTLKAKETLNRFSQSSVRVLRESSLIMDKMRIVLIATISIAIITASFYHNLILLDPDEIIEPQCHIQYQSSTSYLQPLKEQFVISYLGGSKIHQAIVGLVNGLLALFYSDQTVSWLNLRNTQISRQTKSFAALVNKTLERGYTLVNDKIGANRSPFLVNRGGYKVAILKTSESWKEVFVRRFDEGGFFNFPRIAEVYVHRVGHAMAIEYIAGTSHYSNATDFINMDKKIEQFYSSLSMNDLANVIEQRQRIFILDQLIQNADRNLNNLLIGCDLGAATLYPIDHDLSLIKFSARIDFAENAFKRSTFSLANIEYLKRLTFDKIDEIIKDYQEEINRMGKLRVSFTSGKSSMIDHVQGIKIMATLLKIAAENHLTIGKAHLFLAKGLVEVVEYPNREEYFALHGFSESTVRKIISENQIAV